MKYDENQLSLPGILPETSGGNRLNNSNGKKPNPRAKTNRWYWNPVDREDVPYARAYYLLKHHGIDLFTLKVNGGIEDTLETPEGSIEVSKPSLIKTEVLYKEGIRDQQDVEADVAVQEYIDETNEKIKGNLNGDGNGNGGARITSGRLDQLLDYTTDQGMILVEKDMQIKTKDHEIREQVDVLDRVYSELAEASTMVVGLQKQMEMRFTSLRGHISCIKQLIKPNSENFVYNDDYDEDLPF